MRNGQLLIGTVLLALMAALSGCAATVAGPPPAAYVEVRPVMPFYGAVWIDGYYEHNHGRYDWVPGRYVRPPHTGAAWVPGHWQHHNRGWRWHKGYWR